MGGKDEVFKSESEHSDSFRQRDSFSQQLQNSMKIMCNIPGTLLLKPCDIIIVNPLKRVRHSERDCALWHNKKRKEKQSFQNTNSPHRKYRAKGFLRPM